MRSRLMRLAALLLVAVATSACTTEEAAGPVRPAAHTAVVTQGTTGREIRVGLTEWSILLSQHRAPAGPLRLVVTNAGGTEHDLAVRGRAGTWSSDDLAPGQQTTMTVRAERGETLAMWCSMPGHRAQGMHTTLTVGH